MSKSKTPKIKRLVPYGGYGWAGMSPALVAMKLKKAGDNFGRFIKTTPVEAIAFTGSSGAAIGFYLATRFKLPCIYVRKGGEQSHGFPIECNATGETHNYMIADDFISSGATVRRVVRKIERQAVEAGASVPTCVGIICFTDDQIESDFTYKNVTYPVLHP